MPDAPQTVIVNCEAFSLPNEEQVTAIREEAMALLETGTEEGVAAAQNVLAQAKVIEARRDELGPIEEIRDLTDDELAQHADDQEAGALAAAEGHRSERNARLAATDWTQAADVDLTDAEVQAWRRYRQALRDLEFTDADPDWPELPSS